MLSARCLTNSKEDGGGAIPPLLTPRRAMDASSCANTELELAAVWETHWCGRSGAARSALLECRIHVEGGRGAAGVWVLAN
jgi:hypothetical protein